MSNGVWQDPLVYVREWSKAISIHVPLDSEVPYALMGLQHHAALLYDIPSFTGMDKRWCYQRIRKMLALLGDLISRVGFIDAYIQLKELGHVFLRCFKKTEKGQITFDLAEGLVQSPVFLVIHHLHHEFNRKPFEELVPTIKWLYTWHVFLAKMPLDRPDLVDSAREAWINLQNEMSSFELRESTSLDACSRVVGWLLDFDLQNLVGRHGPGSTSTGAKTVPEKNRDFISTIQTVELTSHDPVQHVPTFGRIRPCKWLVVKKDLKSLRPITAEPPEMQYAQQGLKDRWYHANDDPGSDMPISRFVKYSDQSFSQRAALYGSRGNQLNWSPATIDLSAASDRLTTDLVVRLFRGDLLHLLMCGRSWGSQVEDLYVEHAMYGGMGSALTFPVQTTIFVSIAVVATVLALHKAELGIAPSNVSEVLSEYLDHDGFRSQYYRYAKSIRVYGDDIAVPQIAVPYLLELLEEFGLLVNVEKSFYNDYAVREACGMFAVGGADITPLRFRVPPTKEGGLVDFAAFDGLRSLVNRSFFYGYGRLYRMAISYAKSANLFISSKRLKRRWHRIRNGSAYEDQELGNPELLWEEYRGMDDYIGFISTTSSDPTHTVKIWEEVKAFTTYSASQSIDSDVTSEYYHLNLAYKFMTERETLTESHGLINRGIRLDKFNAILVDRVVNGRSLKVWGWAPR